MSIITRLDVLEEARKLFVPRRNNAEDNAIQDRRFIDEFMHWDALLKKLNEMLREEEQKAEGK